MAEGEVKKKGFWAEVAEGVLNGKPEFNNLAPDVKATIRADWIRARVAAKFDNLPAATTGGAPASATQLWDWAEMVYLEGKRRGYLP